ncbi:MAG: NifU family protein, partial [Bacteroidetes bacterium]|nr:NifU family protein [Bacteroidota bacterium]
MTTTIEIVPTTHPGIVKFNLNIFLTKTRSYEFHNVEEAKISPLAQELFYLPFVKTIFISQNFIAIEKYDIVDWKDVQEEVAVSILKYLDSGRDVIIEQKEKAPVK